MRYELSFTSFRQGTDASFEAVVYAVPTAEVVWTREGYKLPNSEKYLQYYNPRTGEVSLTIRQLGPGDEGNLPKN